MGSGPASRAVRLVIRYTVSVLVSVTRLRVFPSPFHQVTVRVRMTLATCLTCGNLAVISSGASMTRWERVSRRPWPRSFVLCRRGRGAARPSRGGGVGRRGAARGRVDGEVGAGLAAAVAAVLRLVPAGAGPAQCLQGGVQERLVALDQEGDKLRRFRALLPCEVVVTALAHPLCGCRGRAYAFRHVDGVPHLKVELPDGMPGLVAADATDVFGAGPAAAGAGLVLDGAGLRHLRAVVTRLRDGDPAGEQR